MCLKSSPGPSNILIINLVSCELFPCSTPLSSTIPQGQSGMPSKLRSAAVSAGKKSSHAPTPSWINSAEMSVDPAASQSQPAPARASDTATILSEIEQSRASLMVRIHYLNAECNLIRADLDKFRGRLSETGSRISTNEDITTQHADSLSSLQNTVQMLVAKSDDAENRMRRNNVRVLGLPEWAEGDHPAEFAEAFKTLLNLTEVYQTYVVERAHRVPTGRYMAGAPL